jgi:1,4-dihydroxy-2-naphthoate octaprenyltransferase
MPLKTYFLETRPQFLILSLVLITLATSMAWYDGFFNIKYTLLTFLGLLLLHISVNTLNDYFDYKSGVDLKAKRTPFSGGSGFLVSGALSAKKTFWLGTISFILSVPIGIYFILNKGWSLLPLFILGAIFVLFYTNFLAKLGLGISEISAGLGLGTLPVLGVYLILNQGFSFSALFASIPSGFLVCNLLLLNEIPDLEADKVGGRKTLPIILGKDGAAKIYSGLTLLVYVWIILGVILKIMPPFTLIAILTLPIAFKAIRGSTEHADMNKFIPVQGANVLIVLLTQFLLGIGYILAKVISL